MRYCIIEKEILANELPLHSSRSLLVYIESIMNSRCSHPLLEVQSSILVLEAKYTADFSILKYATTDFFNILPHPQYFSHSTSPTLQ